MPIHVLSAAIMAAIIYPMAGLRQGFLLWLTVNIASILVGASVMQMVGALSRIYEEANILMMLVMVLSMVMTSGFVREVPEWLQWAREVSMMGLLSDIATYFEFRDIDAEYGTPEEVFSAYGLQIRDHDALWRAVYVLIAIYVCARVIGY